MRRFKKYFVVGVATLLPLFLTIYVVAIIFRFADRIVGTSINTLLLKNYGFTVPGLGIFALLVLFLLSGFIGSHFIGKKLFLLIESFFRRIPVSASIYPSIKQLSDFLFQRDELRRLKKVVLVEYPQKGAYTLGFITNEHLDRLMTSPSEHLISVFVPLAPSPFSGFILLVPQQQVRVLDVSMEEAIKFVVSGGIVF